MSWERDSDREENTDHQFLSEGTHEKPRKCLYHPDRDAKIRDNRINSDSDIWICDECAGDILGGFEEE